MISGSIIITPDAPTPYQVVVRVDGETVRVRPVESTVEGERMLAELLKGERLYEHELVEHGCRG